MGYVNKWMAQFGPFCTAAGTRHNHKAPGGEPSLCVCALSSAQASELCAQQQRRAAAPIRK